MTTVRLSEIISPAFYEVHKAIKSGSVTEVVEAGGRGSCKSSHISVEIPLLIIKNPQMHACVFRKVGNTLRNSVYAQYCWAISTLGLASKFKCTVSPMEITYIKTGQKIMFFGLDDPGKVKSIKVPFGYIGAAHFEELDQYDGPEEIRNVEQSIFRGPTAICFKSFNPPSMARNWANKYILEQKPGKLIHHSNYLSTPPDWLGSKFLNDAEYLKDKNPTAYRHEYLGEVVGSGTEVFSNIKSEEITDQQIKAFDRVYNGVDWGWYPDPFHFGRMQYDAARRTLYIFQEIRANRKSNRETADLLLEGGVTESDLITADSAEPKSVSDYCNYGLYCRGAIKGPDSVRYGMKWLQSLDAIVIDPVRCPETYREFSEYEYEVDKDGTVLEGYPDVDNHSIDMTRYAMEKVWKRRGQ